MATKTRTRNITITDEKGTFATFFKKLSGDSEDYDFEGLKALRNILSNEKAKVLHVVKTKQPGSVYDLAKMLKRDFKSVHKDINVLKRFGFIDLISEKTGKRARLKPVIAIDSLIVEIKV
jgi:predicted transcriptional regulator